MVNVEKCSEPVDCAVNKGDIVLTTKNSDHTWVQAKKCTLTLADKETLLTFGSLLTDKHINYAQVLLQNQFTNVTGLQSTLLQYKPLLKKWTDGLQVIHCRGRHWVVTYKETASTDTVKVYDSSNDIADDVYN